MKINKRKANSTSPIMFHVDFATRKRLYSEYKLWSKMKRKRKSQNSTTK